MPRIDETIMALTGAKYFTVLDLASGFHQVPMADEDIEKTAFTMPGYHLEWLVMPFGLKDAPATFQRVMDMVLGSLKWKKVLVYIDDIIIFSKTFEDHLRDTQEVLQLL